MSIRRRSSHQHSIVAEVVPMGNGRVTYRCESCGHIETEQERAWARMGHRQVRGYLDALYERQAQDRKARQAKMELAA